MKKVALYIRVSTDQQAKHGDSLREQQDTLNSYVNNDNDLFVFDTYIDDGISGQKLQRDEFQRLLNDVKKGNIDIILFTKLDRWFRNLRHYLNTQALLDENHVTWLAVSQPFFNTNTAMGRSFVNQSMSFAELEAQMTSERIRSVFDNKIQKGEVVSGKIPFGYSIENKHLVINESEATIVQDIFDYFLSCANIRQTTNYLEREYNLIRSYQNVRRMLTNRKYIGELRDNKNYCPAIIDKEKFEQVQNLLSKNVKNNKKRDYVFASLLVCSECGRKFSGSSIGHTYVRKDGTKNPNRRNIYRCPKNKDNPTRCLNKKYVYEKSLEKYLIENISHEADLIITEHKNEVKSKKKKNNNNAIKKKLERLKVAYLNEIITLEEYKEDREKLEESLVESEATSEYDKIESLKELKKYLDSGFLENYYRMNNIDRSFIWRSVIENILVHPDGRLEINFIGA